MTLQCKRCIQARVAFSELVYATNKVG